jgi:hypothetical protein
MRILEPYVVGCLNGGSYEAISLELTAILFKAVVSKLLLIASLSLTK